MKCRSNEYPNKKRYFFLAFGGYDHSMFAFLGTVQAGANDDLRRLEWHSDESSPNYISAASVYTAFDDGEVLKAVSFFPR